jgi:uncharacterized protein YndB with AHSA1/START domain
MVHIEASHEIAAAPDTVWKLLADAEGWSRWSPMDESALERPGAADRNGVGALRRFRTGRMVSREEVVVFDAPHHLAYTLVSGLPLRDYRADFRLARTAQGTRVDWSAQFRPPFPGTGWLYAFMIRRFVVRFFATLAAAAEQAQVPAARAAAPSGFATAR